MATDPTQRAGTFLSELFSPERLTLARQRRGLLMQELAARIDVTPKTVSRWERGRRSPEEDNVAALSRQLGFPREYFFGDAPPRLEDWAFRSLARMTARQRDIALAAGAQAVDLDRWIDGLVERPGLNLPDLREHSSEEAAIAVRAAWGLGYKPLPNLVHLLESNGVRVYSLVHEGVDFDAFSVWHGGTPFVFLNTTVTAERSRMDAAHETGHLVLHAHMGGGATKPENDEASAFAANFLMPTEPFIATAPRKVTVASVVEAKQRWGVSALSYVRRLHVLGRISDWQYKSMCIELKTKYRNEEPGPTRTREASKVLAWVFSSSESGISRKDAVRHLRIPMSDLNELTFGLALTPVAGGGNGAQAGNGNGKPDLRIVK